MRIAIVGLAFGLALGAGAAMAQTSVPPALPANPLPAVSPTAAVTIDDDTIICKYERTTGTLLMEQVCRTQRAWKLMQADAKEFMEFGFRGAHQCGEGGCGKTGGGG